MLGFLYNWRKKEKVLSLENYVNDGKEFIETKKYLQNAKKVFEEGFYKYSKSTNEENIMSYINNKELDSYYIDMYKDGCSGMIEKDEEFGKSINEIIDLVDKEYKIIELLAEN